MNSLDLVARAVTRQLMPRASSSGTVLPFDDWLGLLSLENLPYLRTTLQPEREDIEGSYLGLIGGAYRANGIVFACLLARYMLFSEARFLWQQLRQGRPGNLFGTPDLAILEEPEPGRTTGDMLATMMLDADLAGISYQRRQAGPSGPEVARLRPDWTTAVFGSDRKDAVPADPDSHLVGFAYQPGGPGSKAAMMSFLPEEVAWFGPGKDPLRNVVGMPWLLPILRDISGDTAATIHKLAYFRNAATPNLMVHLPATLPKDKAKEWIELFEQDHRGAFNAFRSIYFGGGATAEAVGANLAQLDYRNVQAAGETRIAAASGIHPVLLGFTEGLQGSALNAGNFAAAARWTADRTLRPLWRNAAGSLQRIVTKPNGGTRLWYDDRDVPFLREDVKDAATVIQTQGTTIGGLIKDGWEPDDSVDAVVSHDLSRLVGKHTGLVSVQLQPPGTLLPAPGGQGAAPAPAPAPGAAVTFTGSVAAIAARLADGWTFASAGDAEAYEVARTVMVGPLGGVLAGMPPMRSRGTFWPVTGPHANLGEVPKGIVLPAGHALVRQFPAMFEPDPKAAGVGLRCTNRRANGQVCGALLVRRGGLTPGSLMDCWRCKQAVVA